MNRLFVLLLACVLFNSLTAYSLSQNVKFDRIGADQGLKQSNVTVLFEDHYGFVWIGTKNGLAKYDGYDMINFKNNIDDENSLSANEIKDIEEDAYGNIWIATGNGLNKYDPNLNKFERFFKSQNDNSSLPSNSIAALFVDKNDQLWIGTNKGLSIFNPKNGSFKTYRHARSLTNSLVNDNVRDIVQDKQGRLWIGTLKGLSRLTTESGDFTNYQVGNVNEISHNDILSLFVDSSNRLWIGFTEDGLDIMSLDNTNIRHFESDPKDLSSIPQNRIVAVVESEKGEMWVGTDNGLSLFDEDGSFTVFKHDVNNEHSLSSNILVTLVIGKNDVLWIGTMLGGISVYDKDKYGFDLYQHIAGDKKSLSNNFTGGFAESPQGLLAVATDGGGVNLFDNKTGEFSQLVHKPNNPNSIPNNKVLALEFDDKGGLWIGMWDGGISHYNMNTATYTNYSNIPNDPNSLSSNNIFDLMIDREGLLWVATWGGGLCRFDPSTQQFSSFFNDYDNSTYLRTSGINQIVEDKMGIIWLASDNLGLIRFDPKSGTSKNWINKGEKGDISSDYLFTILIDHKERIWVGSNTGGLNLFNHKDETFTSFRQKDGLPSNDIVGLLEDDQGFIWASTKYGLSRMDTETLEFTNYYKNDGLQGNQFMQRNRLKLSSGELLFGGNGGFNRFSPENLVTNEIPPEIYFSDFKLFNKEVEIGEDGVLKSSIANTEELLLTYEQNFFSLEFVAINYRHSEKNQYKYIMEGLQDEWVMAGAERKVSYTNLESGSYTFKVYGSNNDGLWSTSPAILKIIISPPFWNTWWFRSILIVLFVSVASWVIRWRAIVIKEDKLFLEQKIEEATGKVLVQNDELLEQSKLLKDAIEETNFVVREAVDSGNFRARIDVRTKTGEWKVLGNSINELFESVLNPFEAVNKVVNSLADGDLTERFRGEAKGEILVLSENLNRAMESLSSVLSQMNEQAAVIGDSATDMLVSSEEMNATTGEIATAISEMSKGAQEQVNKVDQSSDLIENILGSSSEMGNQAESINETAKRGVEKSEDGKGLIGKVDNNMQDILHLSEETNESIADLTQRSVDISSVLRIIKEIAAQTNLLALNAAIEAAQAGDAGRGFSVVAEEIRKLAEGSKKSTGEIEALISGVQKNTESTAKLVGVMSESIKECKEATNESMVVFEEMSNYYKETLGISEQIVSATKQQTNDVSDVLELISSVVVIAEEAAAGTEQTASSSNELSSGMVNYTNRSKQVVEIIKKLSEQISGFKFQG